MVTSGAFAHVAQADGGVFIDPHVAVGFNSVQGTHFMGGLDVGYMLDEPWAFGVSAHYAAGEHPSHDREIGGGPFASFTQPVIPSFVILHVREEIDYLDIYDPILRNGDVVDHINETGIASITSIGVHLSFTRNLGLSGGYRWVKALSNSTLDDGRSGTYLGFSIGI